MLIKLSCIIEYVKEVKYLKVNILKGLVEEFSDVIRKDIIYKSTIYIKYEDVFITAMI